MAILILILALGANRRLTITLFLSLVIRGGDV